MAGKRRTKDEWQQLIAEFEAGDESPTIFCRSRGISMSNFCALTVQVGETVIRCDTQTPVTWVAELVAALRA